MNHDEATRYFDDLGERVPDHRPPMADLVSAGQSAVRRKGRRTIGLVAAAVVLVGIGGAAFQHAAQGDDEPPVAQPSAVAPVAPDGMRLVGMGRVVVALPETWVNFQPVCGEPDSGYVYFLPVMNAGCIPQLDTEDPLLQPNLSVGVVDLVLDSAAAVGIDLAKPTTLDDGTLVVESEIECFDSEADLTGQRIGEVCRTTFAVPSEGVAFLVVLPDRDQREQVQAVRDSLQLLADGYTTVPFVEPGTSSSDAERVLNDASLQAVAEGSDASAPILGTNPVAGSVIPLDGTVELLAEPGPSQPTGDDAVEPAPPTYRALLVGTRTSGWVLRVRTFGSSTCPFEMDSVTVVGSVIEVVDQEAKATGGSVCTNDYSPTTAEYEVELTDVDPFLDAKSVVITTLSGDRLSINLEFALE